MSKQLVIVESPAKAKTIARYLGDDFMVLSSFGHIRDLPAKGMSIAIDDNFTPQYEVPADKKKVVAELKKAAKSATTVWLASDEDREGEAIAWHLAQVLGLKPDNTRRIVFHEITKSAITNAVANPRDLDVNLVDAQQARRVLDRLVGYELSPVLWKKVRRGLSAGRVQSVAVRLIVEREREIEAFQASSTFKVVAAFQHANGLFEAELDNRPNTIQAAQKLLGSLPSQSFSVNTVEVAAGQKNPPPPFTTSSLQQLASRTLGYSVKQTMVLAQRLYEAGHITYMRTDSLNISQEAVAASAGYITSHFGAKYHQARTFKTKAAGAQEAHEAIRPTSVSKTSAGADKAQKKLYELIWRRFVASQMAPASVERTTVLVQGTPDGISFKAPGEVLVFDGYLAVAGRDDDRILPKLAQGDSLQLQGATATEVFARPPARYSEASLVKQLEEMGIGRPSTYAPTISTIQDRGYVIKGTGEGQERAIRQLALEGDRVEAATKTEKTGADKNKLLPTDIAGVVTDFLAKQFSSVVDYDFTRDIEEQFDRIALGDVRWNDMIQTFYRPFHQLVEASENVTRSEVAQARQLGEDPASGLPIYARFGRYGPMLQKGETESEDKPVFAPLPAGSKLDTVTLDEALPMFDLPRVVGTTAAGESIEANIGRFGPYVKVGKLFVSIKPEDPLTISEEKARELIAAKEAIASQARDLGDGIMVKAGRYGPYVTDGKKNARIPKGQDPEKIERTTAKKLLSEAKSKPNRSFKRK